MPRLCSRERARWWLWIRSRPPEYLARSACGSERAWPVDLTPVAVVLVCFRWKQQLLPSEKVLSAELVSGRAPGCCPVLVVRRT